MSSLFLFPADPLGTPPEISRVRSVLVETELAGDRLSDRDYLVGEQFLQHVTFAGCSPLIQLSPPQDGNMEFCHLSLSGPFDNPVLYLCTNRSRPRCPYCKHRPVQWKTMAADWQQQPDHEWPCAQCGQTISPLKLDWRHYAAWGRLLVEIHQVYPGEAVPGNSLMQQLQQATGNEWTFGWADTPQLSET